MMATLTLGASIPAIFVAAVTAAAALFTKLNWSVKKKVNFHLLNYSFVKLLLNFLKELGLYPFLQ